MGKVMDSLVAITESRGEWADTCPGGVMGRNRGAIEQKDAFKL